LRLRKKELMQRKLQHLIILLFSAAGQRAYQEAEGVTARAQMEQMQRELEQLITLLSCRRTASASRS
jgi:hypothetical protein